MPLLMFAPVIRNIDFSGFLFAQSYLAQMRSSASVSFVGVVSSSLGLQPLCVGCDAPFEMSGLRLNSNAHLEGPTMPRIIGAKLPGYGGR